MGLQGEAARTAINEGPRGRSLLTSSLLPFWSRPTAQTKAGVCSALTPTRPALHASVGALGVCPLRPSLPVLLCSPRLVCGRHMYKQTDPSPHAMTPLPDQKTSASITPAANKPNRTVLTRTSHGPSYGWRRGRAASSGEVGFVEREGKEQQLVHAQAEDQRAHALLDRRLELFVHGSATRGSGRMMRTLVGRS